MSDPLRDEADLHVEEDGALGVTRGRFLNRGALTTIGARPSEEPPLVE